MSEGDRTEGQTDRPAVEVYGPQGEPIFTLKDPEYAYRSLLEAMNEGAAMLAGDGTILYCNQHLSRLLGIPGEQIIGRPAVNLICDGADRFPQVLHEALGGDAAKAAMTLLSADGSRIATQISLRKMQPDASTPLSMVVTDLSELKKWQASLRESETAFALMAEQVPQLVWMCGADGQAFYFNSRCVKYSGLPLTECYGAGWVKVFHPDDRKAVWNAWTHAVETGERHNIECRLRAADGTYRWFLIQGEPIRSPEGTILRWCGSCTDIEDLKRAEQGQRTQRRIIEEMLRNLPCGVALVRGHDLTLQMVNPVYQALAPHKPMLDRSIDEAWPEVHPLFSERCRAVLETGRPLHAVDEEFNTRREKDGVPEFSCYSWSMHRIPLSGGDDDGIMITLWDTTQRKLAEKALKLQRSQLRALGERMRQVREEERRSVARDLHDRLGQILTAIKMDMAWIGRHTAKEQAGIEDRLARSIALIDEGSGAVRRICRGLRPAILDDLGLAAAIEWEAKEFMTRSGIACTVSVPSGDLSLDGNTSIALFRIFQECLTNVMRHSGARSVRVSLERTEAEVRLGVADDGKGFSESKSSGSLGLLGMKERAHSCGGTLELVSSPGAGTTVTVTIPIRPDCGSEHAHPDC